MRMRGYAKRMEKRETEGGGERRMGAQTVRMRGFEKRMEKREKGKEMIATIEHRGKKETMPKETEHAIMT